MFLRYISNPLSQQPQYLSAVADTKKDKGVKCSTKAIGIGKFSVKAT